MTLIFINISNTIFANIWKNWKMAALFIFFSQVDFFVKVGSFMKNYKLRKWEKSLKPRITDQEILKDKTSTNGYLCMPKSHMWVIFLSNYSKFQITSPPCLPLLFARFDWQKISAVPKYIFKWNNTGTRLMYWKI